LSQTFNKGDVVNVRHGVSNELVKTLEFVQPKGCATPTPSPSGSPTSAPSTSDDNSGSGGLANTGESFGGIAVTAAGFGVGAVLIALVGGVLWLRKRRQSLSS
jgi:LPXTG-motif cell wall-anchored protein